MPTLKEEVEALISADLHAMVDSAVRANSLAVLLRYIRTMEDHLEGLHEAETAVGGEFKALRRRRSNLDQKAAELDRAIDIFLGEGKYDLALAAQSRLNTLERLLETYEGMFQRQEADFHGLKDARLRLQAKRTTVEREREELQVLLDLAHSKGTTAHTARSLDELAEASDDRVSKLAKSIRGRLDQASARSGTLPDNLDAQIDRVLKTKVLESQLAERKARLGLS